MLEVYSISISLSFSLSLFLCIYTCLYIKQYKVAILTIPVILTKVQVVSIITIVHTLHKSKDILTFFNNFLWRSIIKNIGDIVFQTERPSVIWITYKFVSNFVQMYFSFYKRITTLVFRIMFYNCSWEHFEINLYSVYALVLDYYYYYSACIRLLIIRN